MNNNIIMFKSMTSAMKSKELLKKHGINTRIIKTPSQFRNRSCGYSLLVKSGAEKAEEILRSHNIGYIGTAPVDFK